MKKVYLARHGQTEANVSGLFQGPEDPLTLTGQQQATVLADRVESLGIEKVIASDYLRAQQTTTPIVEKLGVPIEYSQLVREERPPTSWIDVYSEIEAKGSQFFADMVTYADDPNWRVEDAENAHDIYKRVQGTIDLLQAETAETILVVSHGTFLKQLIAYVLLDCNATVTEMVAFKMTMKTVNTGITMIYHDGTRWRLLTWNDHAHFAE